MTPTTASPESLKNNLGRDFSVLMRGFLAFASRLETTRTGLAVQVNFSIAARITLTPLVHLEREREGASTHAARFDGSPAFGITDMGTLVRRGVLGLSAAGRALLARLPPAQVRMNDATLAALDRGSFHHLAALLPRLGASGNQAPDLLKETPA